MTNDEPVIKMYEGRNWREGDLLDTEMAWESEMRWLHYNFTDEEVEKFECIFGHHLLPDDVRISRAIVRAVLNT